MKKSMLLLVLFSASFSIIMADEGLDYFTTANGYTKNFQTISNEGTTFSFGFYFNGTSSNFSVYASGGEGMYAVYGTIYDPVYPNGLAVDFINIDYPDGTDLVPGEYFETSDYENEGDQTFWVSLWQYTGNGYVRIFRCYVDLINNWLSNPGLTQASWATYNY